MNNCLKSISQEKNKMYCAALLKKTKLNAVAAISQLTIAFHRHLIGFIANLRAGEGRSLPACKLIEIQAHDVGECVKLNLLFW